MSSQRLFGILVLAVVALAAIPRESSGAPLVVGQDYYSVQLLSGTSAAVLQESLALVADQPYARIEKRGAEYTLRLGYWESRDEAVQAAKVLLPKFRGAHTRIAPYQPDAIVAGAGEQPPIAAVPHPLTGARAPGGGTRETTVQAEREAAKLAAERAEAERRAEAAAQERSAAEARALREATIRQQAEAQAEAAARERVAAEREAMAQAVLREKAETEALRLAESRRDAERRPTAEVSPLRAEPEQSQAQLPGMPRPPQLVAGQDYHSVQLLSGTSVAVLQESLARVAGEPYARIDKRGAGYALRVGYWDSRAEAVQAAKALLPKFRDAHARIATYRPDAIVAGAGEQSSRAAAPVPSVPEASPRRIGSAQSQTQRPDMRGWQPVVGQDYYSVQLLSGTSAAVLQESRALVADQPYVRIEKRGAEYMLRVGYWESRDEAVQAAKVLSPKFRGAHTRIAPYQPEVIVAGIGE
ncbi:MAG: SPOR domain-containing protein, partial [Betaproteobacteria bacterium]|nr:SPOR domain-containing protein [Betaproteobacteria bacterium]